MKIKFCGADREVTGSCHLVETNGQKFLIDCGMYQGSNFNEGKNFDKFLFDPKEIRAVLITHGHLDHIGRLPKLVKEGFSGKIYLTKGTAEITKLVLEDALGIMINDNKKFDCPILFSSEDVSATVSQFHAVNYNEEINLGNEIKAIWKDAGHIFGSAFIEFIGEGKKICFSGDIGNDNAPIIKDTEDLGNVDFLVCESTYGDRIHEDEETRKNIVLNFVSEGVKRGGTIMIPAFSVERTQELLYILNSLSEYDKNLPKIPIYLDSPLAIDITKVFEKYPEYYDKEASELYKNGDDFLNFSELRLAYTKEMSKKINEVRGPKMVIAGAGMMNGGRILHHALRYLPDPNSTLMIVGYQAEGSLGRKLYEGAKDVNIFNQKIFVNCKIKAIGALSAHGDQRKILSWIKTTGTSLKKVFCVHGELNAVNVLADKIKNEFEIETFATKESDIVEI